MITVGEFIMIHNFKAEGLNISEIARSGYSLHGRRVVGIETQVFAHRLAVHFELTGDFTDAQPLRFQCMYHKNFPICYHGDAPLGFDLKKPSLQGKFLVSCTVL